MSFKAINTSKLLVFAVFLAFTLLNAAPTEGANNFLRKLKKKGKITNDCEPDSKIKFLLPSLNKKPDKMTTCKKLLKKKKTREALCKITEVQNNCQKTCATCEIDESSPSVCEDTTLKFFIHDSDVETKKPRKKDCDWYVGKGYCDSSDTVKSMCPVSCDNCFQKFKTTDELEAEVLSFCSNPATYDVTKYGNITFWDVSDIEDMGHLFDGYSAVGGLDCTPNVTSWNVSKVTNFGYMFAWQPTFNLDLSSWNVSNGRNFAGMFNAGATFNRDIGSWNVSNGQNFASMFHGGATFNQDIGSWNVSNGQDFARMFNGATDFNQDIGSWNVSNGTDFTAMFNGATSFDQDLCDWTSKNGLVSTASDFCSTCLGCT